VVAELGTLQHSATAISGTGASEAAAQSVAAAPVPTASQIITSVDGIGALRADYEHLCGVTSNTLPFALHEWHLSWCQHFLNRSAQIHEQPHFCVLRSVAGECLAIIPLIVSRRRLGPLRLATVALLGGDPGLTEIQNPLVRPGFEQAAVRAVYQSLGDIPDWDWLRWNSVNAPLAGAIAGAGEAYCWQVSEDFVLDLPEDWEQLRVRLPRNLRESLRHCYNSLKRDGHTFEFVVARQRDEVHQAVECFLRLHALRARMPWGPKHPDRFATPGLKRFLHDVCDRLTQRDAVRVFQLKIGREIVASRIGFVTGGGLYLYYSGFDPAWARYSVMTTTLAEALRYAIASGLTSANLSPNPEQSKLRWRPRRVSYHSALIQHDSLGSRIACRAYRLVLTSQGAPGRLLKGFFWSQRNWQ
jgi:CelD/BcsL family acetyltransferase involved in cellulose biosynthesis